MARGDAANPFHMTPEEGREVMPRHGADADCRGLTEQKRDSSQGLHAL